MKFENMVTSDFTKLNLTPLKGRCEIKSAIGIGEVYVYRRRGGKLCISKEKPDNINYRTIKIDNYEDITEEQFLNVLMLTEAMTAKYIWLQKYLKGETSGTYSKEDDENLIKISVKNAIADKEEIIAELKRKIKIISEENAEIKSENKKLKSEIKEYEKVKKAIEEIQKINL